jgi:hypothetical protein
MSFLPPVLHSFSSSILHRFLQPPSRSASGRGHSRINEANLFIYVVGFQGGFVGSYIKSFLAKNASVTNTVGAHINGYFVARRPFTRKADN